MCTCLLQKSVESLSFSEPSASKPIEPSIPTFAASSASPHSPPPSAPADRPPAARPPAVEKAPDIDKKAAVEDDKVRQMYPADCDASLLENAPPLGTPHYWKHPIIGNTTFGKYTIISKKHSSAGKTLLLRTCHYWEHPSFGNTHYQKTSFC